MKFACAEYSRKDDLVLTTRDNVLPEPALHFSTTITKALNNIGIYGFNLALDIPTLNLLVTASLWATTSGNPRTGKSTQKNGPSLRRNSRPSTPTSDGRTDQNGLNPSPFSLLRTTLSSQSSWPSKQMIRSSQNARKPTRSWLFTEQGLPAGNTLGRTSLPTVRDAFNSAITRGVADPQRYANCVATTTIPKTTIARNCTAPLEKGSHALTQSGGAPTAKRSYTSWEIVTALPEREPDPPPHQRKAKYPKKGPTPHPMTNYGDH